MLLALDVLAATDKSVTGDDGDMIDEVSSLFRLSSTTLFLDNSMAFLNSRSSFDFKHNKSVITWNKGWNKNQYYEIRILTEALWAASLLGLAGADCDGGGGSFGAFVKVSFEGLEVGISFEGLAKLFACASVTWFFETF